MGEIVVGYDGSDCSKLALDKAVEAARAFGDRLVIVFGYAPGGYGGGEVPTHREAVKEMGEKLVAEADRHLGGSGVEHEVELLPMKPAHALIEAAAQHGARMIVLGSHGETPLKGAIIGSTPYRLLHEATVPVLVVRASAE